MTAESYSGVNRLAVKVTSQRRTQTQLLVLKTGFTGQGSRAADKGKANKELIDFLSERLGIRKSAIAIITAYRPE